MTHSIRRLSVNGTMCRTLFSFRRFAVLAVALLAAISIACTPGNPPPVVERSGPAMRVQSEDETARILVRFDDQPPELVDVTDPRLRDLNRSDLAVPDELWP